jgi:hypothetical protein
MATLSMALMVRTLQHFTVSAAPSTRMLAAFGRIARAERRHELAAETWNKGRAMSLDEVLPPEWQSDRTNYWP